MIDVSPTTSVTAPRAAKPWARLPAPVLLGALIGGALVYLAVEAPPKWLFYVCGGVSGVVGLSILSRLIGRIDRFCLGLFVFSLPLLLGFTLLSADSGMPGGVQGFTFSLQLITAIAYWITWRFRPVPGPDDDDRRIVPRRFLKACLTFYGCLVPSLLTTTTKMYTFYGLFYHATLLLVALTASHICSSRSGLKILWQVVGPMLIMQSIVMLIQRQTGVSFQLTGEVIESPWGERVGGTMGAAPSNAATLLMGLLLFAEVRLLRGSQQTALRWAPIFGLGLLCLLLSLTRSAWIGFGIASVFLLGWILRHGTMSRARWIPLAGLAFFGLIIAWGPVHDRLGANHERAADERWLLNYVNLEMIKDHPIVGIGLNTAYDSKYRYVPKFFTDGDWVYIAHNQYLLVAAETGILGLGGFLWILLMAFRSAAAGARAPDTIVSETGAVLFAYLLGFVWGMNLDFYGGTQIYTVLWFIFGAAVGVRALAEREAQECSVEPARAATAG